MSLKDVVIKKEYRSLIDNVAKDFYIPLLGQAVSYKRAVGFFSSSALVEISKGISSLIENGGTVQLVASPYLSEDDVLAIKKGYELRGNIICNALLRELHEPTAEFDKKRLNLLANLIASGKLDIKIALTEQNGGFGMYHEKMGIIIDSAGNRVAFSGSMNESATAMSVNYETIDVFCSWSNKEDEDRVFAKENAFTSIWNNAEPNIETIDFPMLKEEIINRYKSTAPDFTIDNKEYDDLEPKKVSGGITAIPKHIKLHDYQVNAIDEWERQNYCGIFDMATGTGKTYTGLGAAVRLSEKLSGKLAIFIVCPYQHLVEQWVEDIVAFGMTPIIGYSNSEQKDWRKRLSSAIRFQKISARGKEFFCFICTNATYASKNVQEQIAKIKSDALIIVDEAHNFGATRLSEMLPTTFRFRLALSATLERHNDDEGTEKLKSYFGDKCIEYPLERAIAEGKLTPYKYYPVIVSLTEAELVKYTALSYEMSKNLTTGKNGKVKLSKYGEILAIKRSRIVAAATEKLYALTEKITPYKEQKHILVYCGATNVFTDDDSSEVEQEELRQIEVVTDILGNKLGMSVAQFTSREKVDKRALLKQQFQKGDTLQALIAIKCLDEGVNIPNIRTAFILASTTNPKEYIQRRGRVLRLSKGKDFAEIYDFITLPRPLNEVSSLTTEQMQRDISLIKNELARGMEFAQISLNAMDANSFLWKIREAYGLYDEDINFTEIEEDINS